MSAYNFKERFVPLIESGQKRSTIRAVRLDGRVPKPNEELQLYTGMRTKACRLIGVKRCVGVAKIKIEEDGITEAKRKLPLLEADYLAERDGFKDQAELIEWFKAEHGLPFQGNIIVWR